MARKKEDIERTVKAVVEAVEFDKFGRMEFVNPEMIKFVLDELDQDKVETLAINGGCVNIWCDGTDIGCINGICGSIAAPDLGHEAKR